MQNAFLALALAISVVIGQPAAGSQDNSTRAASTFEERSAAEKMSRSRYRDLEVASLVLILAVGAGAILWAVRRK